MTRHDRPHILVVEDDAKIAEMLALTLEMNGYRTSRAANGRLALELLQSDNSVALLILDLLMPEMDGVTFFSHLRSEPSLSGIPVIIASALAPPTELQAAAVLRKPLVLNALLSAVDRALLLASSAS